METDLLTAFIDAAATILSTAIPSLVAFQATKKVVKLRQAKSTALAALTEVIFLRYVETKCCEKLSDLNGKTAYANRLEIRKLLAKDSIRTEGKLSPSEVSRRIKVYLAVDDTK